MRFLVILIQLLVFSVRGVEGYRPAYEEIVYDIKQKKIIHSLNIDQKTQPASLTKMMTLYITFSKINNGTLKLTDRVQFSRAAVNQRPSILGVKIRNSITVKEAIFALITKSANDVAVALAEKIAGTEKKFVDLMNFYARELKMRSTVFKNASGWKDRQQLTTARDMVKLSLALINKFPSFYPYFSMKSFSFEGKKWRNHNKLVCKCPSRFKEANIVVDGIKTGYVAASGFNLSTSAMNNKGRRLIAVILGGPTAKWRDERMADMLCCCFNNMKPQAAKIDNYYSCRNQERVICSLKKQSRNEHSKITDFKNKLFIKNKPRCRIIRRRISGFNYGNGKII